MGEPFGGAMTMGEWSHHPQLLRSKGNAIRGQGSRSGGSGVTSGAASKQPDAGWERSGTGEAAGEGDGV